MKLTTRIFSTILLGLAFISLQACSHFSGHNYYDDDYSDNVNYQEGGHAAGDSDGGGSYRYRRGRPVVAPNSYHFSGNASPTKHKDRDMNWIRQQNPDGYTIELANDAKPSTVAKVLHSTPKSARMAQVRTKKGFTGIYGTFKDRQEAEAALQKLPENLRNKAGVREWNKVQSELKPREIHRPSTPAAAPGSVTIPNGAAEQ